MQMQMQMQMQPGGLTNGARVPPPPSPLPSYSYSYSYSYRSFPVSTRSSRTSPANSLKLKHQRRLILAAAAASGGDDGAQEYFGASTELVIGSNADGGPPRWFSFRTPSAPDSASPVLLFLPGLHGVGSGLIHHDLTDMFNVWCLHIPLQDRTPFLELVKLVEETVRSESKRRPTTPIYLVGESFGGCLALAVASRNPHIHLVLILANPATSFTKSQAYNMLPLSQMVMIPDQMNVALVYFLALTSGLPWRIVTEAIQKGLPLDQTFRELANSTASLSTHLSVLARLLTPETLKWKMNLLNSAAQYTNSRLHAVKARTLILASGRDTLLPSLEDAQRLRTLLPNCEIRVFSDSGHSLFLEDGFDLVTVIQGASFYQRGTRHDYVRDYLPPKPSQFDRVYEPHRWTEVAYNPVMLSTLEDGKIVRGLSGVPSEGPVIYVGYHMMLGFELIPLVSRFWMDRGVVLRGVAHPVTFRKLTEGSLLDPSTYDAFRVMGAVPVSATNFYKLLSTESHVLLYPGGMREALHRKGEEYKLMWPEQSEFVRMAARFGAKIVPFGAVGEDDFGQLVFDYDDLMKIPYFKNSIKELTQGADKLRSNVEGEVGKQDIHLPIYAPKLPPGRLYFLFGKPIETQGRKQELKENREAAEEVYAEVKAEVEARIAYLKHKRESDPYRNLLARLPYQAVHGFHTEVPTFELDHHDHS